MALKGANVKLEIQKTLDTAVTITGITAANPPVVSHSGTDPSEGDIVVLKNIEGMVELNGQAARVANVSAGVSFELEGIDASNYSTFSSGTGEFAVVSAWETISTATDIQAGDSTPTELDATTLIDKVSQTEYGIPGAASGSVTNLYNPANAGMQEVRDATRNDEERVLRVTFAGGQIIVFNAKISGGQGFNIPKNGLVTNPFNFSQVRENVYYSS